ncbi:MAG: ATP-binding protein [Candidatus Saccharibacteria bacterium]
MDIALFLINLFSIVGIFAIAAIILMSGFSRQKLFFALFIGSLCVWLLLQCSAQFFSLNGEIGLRLIQIDSLIPFVSALLFLFFIREYLGKSIPKKIYVFSLIFTIAEIFLNISGLMIQEAWGEPAGVVTNKFTELYLIYSLVIGLVFLVPIIQLIKNSLSNKIEKEKSRNRLIIIAILQIVIISILSAFLLSSSAIAQMTTPISILIMAVMIGFAIIRHGLFDIKSAIIRTSAYALSLITLAAVYFGLAYLTSMIMFSGQSSQAVSVNPVNIILALLLAFIFQPVKRFFDKITNKIFYKDNYNTDDFFAKLNKILGFTTDLRGLLEHTATTIGQTLKGEQAFFFINMGDGHYVTAGSPKHKVLPKSDADQLGTVPPTKNGVIIASLLEDADPIKRLMISHRIELVLLLVQDGKALGYLCLGDHLTSSYTNRDIKVLNTISNELIIAIQNALAVQEIREFNITLQQRIANATRELRASNAQLRHLDKAKDEFLSMASHQLRTPLTSVKGYISMIMDGDAGKVTSDQKKLLGEAFGNSERMVGLINDFLSVSRIQTGRFVIDKTPLDLSLVVEQETNSLKQNASARQMELVYEKQPDFPMLDIDEGKIRQVIMNFIDNAIYYSHPGTSINVSMQVQGKDVVFTVKDTGIGVPASERDELFTKFYRASNAKKTRPDGTGVGLFLAKKIVDDHDGKIIFESVEGKGSTFGFSLPIKELAAADQADDLKN